MSIIEDRIDTLEMRFAQQEKTIGELNDVITALWKKLEAMERQLLRFGAEIEALGSSESPPIQKPPHY